ncbi:peptidylprolyl isomerase [Paenibacillus qinlingensis]|uniref:peptidylprolyl isomerase n=1 Tax=Paenibacillus qinlingensis TaxID=1837343 RepID=UPI001565D9C0|nr:peptidylprolyl isomerase [Paenibacillus qinlingensis]NQX58666.1 peptidyl-prolyl cis-trans isomerase [Paenibacillus qinlingensis]
MKNKAIYHRTVAGNGKGAWHSMRSPRLMLFAACLIGFTFIGILWWNLTQAQAKVTTIDNEEVIATVNGESIVEQELQWQMKKLRSHADGNLEENVADKRELALNESIQLKAQLLEAQRRGLLESVRYADYVTKWQSEQIRRKNAALNNEVVYGPITVEEDHYYDFFVADILAKLRDHMMAEKPFSQEEIAAYYQEHLSLYKKPNRLQTNMFVITFGKELSKDEAFRTAQSIAEGLKRGEDADKLLQQENRKNFVLQQRAFNEQTAKQDTMNGTDVWRSVQTLREADVTNPIEENGSYYIFQCLALEDTGFLPLEKASPGIEIALMEQAFPRMTERWVKESTVIIKTSTKQAE